MPNRHQVNALKPCRSCKHFGASNKRRSGRGDTVRSTEYLLTHDMLINAAKKGEVVHEAEVKCMNRVWCTEYGVLCMALGILFRVHPSSALHPVLLLVPRRSKPGL